MPPKTRSTKQLPPEGAQPPEGAPLATPKAPTPAVGSTDLSEVPLLALSASTSAELPAHLSANQPTASLVVESVDDPSGPSTSTGVKVPVPPPPVNPLDRLMAMVADLADRLETLQNKQEEHTANSARLFRVMKVKLHSS